METTKVDKSMVDKEEKGDVELVLETGDLSGVQAKGTWKHAAFHIATTIATPAAYAPLPFAVASLSVGLLKRHLMTIFLKAKEATFLAITFQVNLYESFSRSILYIKIKYLINNSDGFHSGVVSLVGATLATWYSSILIASLWRWNGNKHATYRHLARSIYGVGGYWSIAIFQQVASLGNNIAIHIAAGTSLKAVYKHYHKDGTLTLQHFIIFFGIFELFLSQLPNIHSLRWVNALCTLSTIGFAGTTIGVTIYNGKNIDRELVSYSLQGSSSMKMFRAFNALGTIAFSFGDAMLPEIQSTIREPEKKNMYKGVSTAYGIIILTYWQLAFTGFWAFGSEVQPYVVASLTNPQWTIVMANLFAVFQIAGCFQIYCRPTYAYFEEYIVFDKKIGKYPFHKHLNRFVFTSIYMALITLVAAAMPFFGDFVSICGAIGFTPLDFVFPALAYLKAGKEAKNTTIRRSIMVLNVTIVVCFSVVAVLGLIGAVKFIVEDVKTYKFFHDM